jgi:hypothetical protein
MARRSDPTREQWCLGKQLEATAVCASTLFEANDGETEAINDKEFVDNVCKVLNANVSTWQIENVIALYQEALKRKKA